jgi:hypothetical protein
MSHLFRDRDNTYSWRKILTAIAGFVFSFSCMGVMFGLPPLPGEYLIIISGIILSYFVKKRIGGPETAQ